MISKYGSGTVTQRDDSFPDAPLVRTASSLTEEEHMALLNEESVEEE